VNIIPTGDERATAVNMFQSTWVRVGDNFTIGNVPPGVYTLVGRGAAQPASGAARSSDGNAPRRGTFWAATEVAVDGEDIGGISLRLQETLTLSGRLQFEGSTTTPDMRSIRITLIASQTPGAVTTGVEQAQADASGAFSFDGVAPGRYRLSATIPSANAYGAAWQLKSSIVRGQDAAETPIEIRESITGVVITLTDRVSQIEGVVQDASGKAIPDYGVLAFTADRASWPSLSRRVRFTKPDADGKYFMPNLPPGDYFICAIDDVEPGEWYDPTLLDRLSRGALRITLAEGEKKTLDLRLAVQIP
jgi:hypothetical protein